MAKLSTKPSNVNTASEPIGRSKKVKKTYSKRRKLHGPGKINKEIVEKEDQEEDMGDEDKENEDDDMMGEDDNMEGSGADNNEGEVEKSSGILGGGDQRDNDNDRNRSSPELGQHGDEEQAMEETDTVAGADKSEDEVEEEQGEALFIDRETLSTSAATTAGAANISSDLQPSPSLPQLKRKRGRPSGSKLEGQRTQKAKRTSISDPGATQQYYVQTILAVRMMRFNGGGPEKGLLVHWKDFDEVKDLSWEPERILREDALEIVEEFYHDWTGEEE
ncbi:hypothetical protein NA56DRAFT_665949 [Hyaloscypha hepaticicola]|uniref:Chromo domain-containing protein n=1 Tax=Hyaloscypha hepaticicola TaxID=2082293 RepID=A0A2J6PG28_9HELO|nr:hypothetical protein NA56DRAFT_665949 [Hyaloscypha hepaticicola]